MTYQLVKSIHLVFVVSWFAAMFYIFRLFVYHAQNWADRSVYTVFQTMERKLCQYIMLPGSVGALATGVLLIILNPALLEQNWLILKLVFVLLLFFYSAYSYWVYKQFLLRRPVLSEKQCRIINELPTLCLIAISVLVFTKSIFGL